MAVLYVICIAVLVGIDQYTKNLATINLLDKPSVQLIDNVFALTYTTNKGAAWGILSNQRILLLLITIVILIFIVVYFWKIINQKGQIVTKISLILIISGAIGNAIDRFFKGFVVDFFNFYLINFPVFNFADIFVVCGAILMLISIVTKSDKNNL